MRREGDLGWSESSGGRTATIDLSLKPDFQRPSLHVVEDESEEELYFALRSEIEKVNVGFVNFAPQVRPEIKAQPLDELKSSLKNDKLGSPPMYALLNRDELQSYLDSVNETWSTDASIEEFRPEGPDLYRIVVFGHRRTKAAMEVAIDKGFSLDDTYIDAQVLYHPSTHEILSAQLAEGIMIPPPPEREAALIENTYRTGLAVGRYESMADFERKSPMGISKITNAVHFMQLPDSVRELVADTDNGYKLNYTRALLLRRIAEPYGAWLRRHPNLIPHLELADYDVPSNEQIEKAVEERMFKALRDSPKKTPRCGDGLVERLPWSTAKLGEYVRDRIEFWTSDVAEDSLTLFESAAERSRKEREEADIKEMTRLLDGGVIYAKMLGQIAARMPERLKERTRAQRLRVASRLSRLSNVAEEASSAIYAQLADEE